MIFSKKIAAHTVLALVSTMLVVVPANVASAVAVGSGATNTAYAANKLYAANKTAAAAVADSTGVVANNLSDGLYTYSESVDTGTSRCS